jgi:hypothetical protein
MPAGRPTKYDPMYCDMLVAHMETGMSVASFAAEIDVARSTINEWAGQYPEFSEALSRAKARSAAAWERRAIKLADEGGAGAQATMILFGLKNMSSDDWKDKIQTEHSGTVGVHTLSDEELERRIRVGGGGGCGGGWW